MPKAQPSVNCVPKYVQHYILSRLNSAEPGAGKANVVIKLWGLLRRCCSVVGEGIRRGGGSPKYKD